MLLIAPDDVRKVGNTKLKVSRDNFDGFQMMWLGYEEMLTFILVSVFFANTFDFCWMLPFLVDFFLLFSEFDESHLRRQGKMGQGTINYTFIYFLPENIFFEGCWLFKIFNVKLANVHHITDVELAKPTLWLCDP